MGDQQAVWHFASLALWPTCLSNDSGHFRFHPLVHLIQALGISCDQVYVPFGRTRMKLRGWESQPAPLNPESLLRLMEGDEMGRMGECWGAGVWTTALRTLLFVSRSCQAGLGGWRAHNQRSSA